MDKMTVLGRTALYASAPRELQRRIAAAATYAHVDAGDFLYRDGDLLEAVALVGQGDIRVFKTSASGRAITLYHVKDGEACLVNMLCAFLGRPAMASAQVEAPTEGVLVPSARFREWLGSEESVRTFVFSTLADRLANVMTLVEEVAFQKMDVRLAELLARQFTERRGASNTLTTTHEELAAELGTAREVVSRLLKDFERAGMLSVGRGQVELLDESMLRALKLYSKP